MTRTTPSPASGHGAPDPVRQGASPAPPARGNDSAFEEIVAAHQRRVEVLASRLLGWSDDVQDVVQEVFLSALRNWKAFRGESSVSTWLTAITVNQCRTLQRRQWLLRHLPLRRLWDRGAAAPDPSREGADAERLERVRQVVSRLKRPLREAVVLRYLEGLPAAEVAKVLRLSESAVAVRLHRARARLREMLGGILES